MGRTRQISPDGVLDLDRGGSLHGKRAVVGGAQEYAERVADREDLRDLMRWWRRCPGCIASIGTGPCRVTSPGTPPGR
jgi:hypothetical protein